jgi:hypothetical protein
MSGSGRREPPARKETDEAANKKFREIRIGLKLSQTSDQSCELALAIEKGLFVRSLVLKVADEALAAADRDSAEAERFQRLQEEFLSSFDAFASDSQIPKSSRPAALGAILNALFIGLFSDDPDRRIRIIREFEQQRAARARAAREKKSAPEKRRTLAAVRKAMQATATKPTRGVGYAKRIGPKVVKFLKRDVSLWQIRDLVRVILEESPGKRGKS